MISSQIVDECKRTNVEFCYTNNHELNSYNDEHWKGNERIVYKSLPTKVLEDQNRLFFYTNQSTIDIIVDEYTIIIMLFVLL